MNQATLGGGFFWCLDAIFRRVKGILSVKSGFAGGHDPEPTYEKVCTTDTGHAEVVHLQFDPETISYQQILEIFFASHDPTTVNRQGNDIGPQYRSVIFYHDDQQHNIAEEVMATLIKQKVFDYPLVTELVPWTCFHEAEEYHQGFFDQNPMQPYCAFVVSPKLAQFREKFAHYLKAE